MSTKMANVLAATVLLLSGCTGAPLRYSTARPALVQATLGQAGIEDRRPEFRQIFCQLVATDPRNSTGDCDHWLTRLADDPVLAGEAKKHVSTPPTADIVIVPGVFAECINQTVTVLSDAAARLREQGYQVSYAPVRGRAGSEANARILRDHVVEQLANHPGRRTIVISYSKGTSDAMTALASYPELHQQVVALISIAGVVNGSPLADQLEGLYASTVGAIDLHACTRVDEMEVVSLTRRVRLNWLRSNPLPSAPMYFSIVAAASPDRVSAVMRPFYDRLAYIEPLNDGQVISYDAILPGSALLGFANADHFAVAIPFETALCPLALSMLDQNRYPRVQLVEAAVQIVELSLAQRALAQSITQKNASYPQPINGAELAPRESKGRPCPTESSLP